MMNDLFVACGKPLMTRLEALRFYLLGRLGIGRLHRACLSYNGKTSQVFQLMEKIDKNRILVVDYDKLVSEKERVLPMIYRFVELDYSVDYLDPIHNQSLDKPLVLSSRETEFIKRHCMVLYQSARRFLTM